MSVIYALAAPSGEIRYVGKTARDPKRRKIQHESDARRGMRIQRRLSAWLRSVDCCSTLVVLERDPDDLDAAEREWISLLRAAGARLCNMTDGGEGQRVGWKPSAATRMRMSEAQRGRVRSEAECRAISERQRGRVHSPETRARIAAARTGGSRAPHKSGCRCCFCHHTPEHQSLAGRAGAAARWRDISELTGQSV